MYASVLEPEKLTGQASVHEHPAHSCGPSGELHDLKSPKYVYDRFFYIDRFFSLCLSFFLNSLDSNTTVQLLKLHLTVSRPLDDDRREVQR